MVDPKAQTNQKQKDTLDKRLDAIGWALFFIMIGGLWLAPEGMLPEGTWLIGTGVIILGMTWIRRMNGLIISGFWVFMGILALGTGIWPQYSCFPHPADYCRIKRDSQTVPGE